MRKVQIKTDSRTCRNCESMAINCGCLPPCEECKLEEGTWINTVSTIFGICALILLDSGDVIKVDLSRIKVID